MKMLISSFKIPCSSGLEPARKLMLDCGTTLPLSGENRSCTHTRKPANPSRFKEVNYPDKCCWLLINGAIQAWNI